MALSYSITLPDNNINTLYKLLHELVILGFEDLHFIHKGNTAVIIVNHNSLGLTGELAGRTGQYIKHKFPGTGVNEVKFGTFDLSGYRSHLSVLQEFIFSIKPSSHLLAEIIASTQEALVVLDVRREKYIENLLQLEAEQIEDQGRNEKRQTKRKHKFSDAVRTDVPKSTHGELALLQLRYKSVMQGLKEETLTSAKLLGEYASKVRANDNDILNVCGSFFFGEHIRRPELRHVVVKGESQTVVRVQIVKKNSLHAGHAQSSKAANYYTDVNLFFDVVLKTLSYNRDTIKREYDPACEDYASLRMSDLVVPAARYEAFAFDMMRALISTGFINYFILDVLFLKNDKMAMHETMQVLSKKYKLDLFDETTHDIALRAAVISNEPMDVDFMLIHCKVNINASHAIHKMHRTVLHDAIVLKLHACVAVLLEHGASMEIPDAWDATAYALGTREDMPKEIRMLFLNARLHDMSISSTNDFQPNNRPN